MSGRRVASPHERGQATMFGLGLVLVAVVVAGLAVDLWRIVDARRSLAAEADAVAAAAANGIDLDAYRAGGELVLDPVTASELASQRLASLPDGVVVDRVDVTPASIEVRLIVTVDLVLLDVGRDAETIEVVVTGRAVPRRGT